MARELPIPTEGRHYIIARGFRGVITIVVARTTLRGRRWGRFVRMISAEGWWATCHNTRREAIGAEVPRLNLY